MKPDAGAVPSRIAGAGSRRPPAWRSPQNVLRAGVFVACLLPLARLLVLGFSDGLGANPVEFISRSTGTWTLVALCVVLGVTPLRRITGWNGLARLRRMLGLFAFFYACLHLAAFVWFEHWFDMVAVLKDVIDRPFVTAGFAALMLMVPLAATSTNSMMRRLGRRWAELHRAVYAVAVLAVLHYVWHKAGKNDFAQPLAYAAVVAALLGWRVWWRWRRPG